MVDLNLKVPALEMLLKYTASGIGAVAGPMPGPWRARRAATVRRIEAEAERDNLKTYRRRPGRGATVPCRAGQHRIWDTGNRPGRRHYAAH